LDLGKIQTKVIRFGQNQNLTSPKNIRSPMAMLQLLLYYNAPIVKFCTSLNGYLTHMPHVQEV